MMVELLSEDAHHLFRDLVASGGRPLGDAVDAVPLTPALQELIQRGLAWQSTGPVPLVYAVSPVAAMRHLLSNEQQHVIHAHRRIIERYAELESLERRYQPSGAAGFELLSTPAAVNGLAHELTADVRTHSRVICPPDAGELRSPTHQAPAGDVRHRRLVGAALLADPGVREVVAASERAGVEHRVLAVLPAPMVVTPDAALLWLRPAPQTTALLIPRGALLDSLAQLFDLLWKQAAPLAAPASAAGTDLPTPVQSQILRMAAAGLKDEAIARSLGRSTRWVRRHFEVLEERLDATNRMTLGIAATRRGWL